MVAVFLFFFAISMAAVPLKAAGSENQIDENLDVTDIIAKANAGIKTPLIHGDIAPSNSRNAVPCTATGCKWPKTGQYVYIPIEISSVYTLQERDIIIRALVSFHSSTCIRFVWRNPTHRDFINFYSGSGCWSYLGRQGGQQLVSLMRNGCLYHSTVQHEVNHALGFHHEQVRSDRDSFVQVLPQNIIPGNEHNFAKVQTNNLGTPYDFNSVMHYTRTAFSRNGQPTLISKANPSLDFGRATQMSANDIARINRLYGCCCCFRTFIMIPVFLSLLFISVVNMSPVVEPAQYLKEFMDVFKSVPQLQADKEPKRYDDIAMPKILKRNADPCTVIGCKWFKSGEYVYIPYYIDTNYSPAERNRILGVLQSFNRSTCIRFVPFNRMNSDYLYFYTRPTDGCWSYIGRQGGGQFISLEKNKCLRTSTVSHEVLHALGFHHEQVRIDRDEYIRVLFQNIKPEQKFNFWKVKTNNMGSPYDYNSVMHYKKYAFSKNGRPTIAARSRQIHSFGNPYGMSNTDIDRVNKLYSCRKI